jgi:hypothetical protein
MILIDYSQTAISTLMAEVRGRKDIHVDVGLIRHMILNTIRSYKMKYGSKYGSLVICCDGRKYWRKQEFVHYKAGRKKAREESGLNWEDLFAALNQVKAELAEFFPYPVVEIEGAEADDVIATLVLHSQSHDLKVPTGTLFDDPEPEKVLILSGDHDFLQLHRHENVSQYSPIQKMWVKATEPADWILTEHILRGDKGDGVPNVLSADDTFVTGARQKPLKTELVEEWKRLPWDQIYGADVNLRRNFDRNRAMVDLRNVPPALAEAIIHSYEAQKGVRGKGMLLNFFIKNRMRNMIELIQEF